MGKRLEFRKWVMRRRHRDVHCETRPIHWTSMRIVTGRYACGKKARYNTRGVGDSEAGRYVTCRVCREEYRQSRKSKRRG